jgi:translation initiation factor 3 subunit B
MLRMRPKETDGIESVVVVDGLPVVGEDRMEKLKGVIRKIFGKFGTIITEHYASPSAEVQATS